MLRCRGARVDMRGLALSLCVAVLLAAGTVGSPNDRQLGGEGQAEADDSSKVCRIASCAECGGNDVETRFLQAERMLRNLLQGSADGAAKDDMRNRIRELLDHGGGRPSRRTPMAVRGEVEDDNDVLFNERYMQELRDEVSH